MVSKARPYKLLDIDGWQVLIGRGALENDQLTFRVASPRDTWLHVAGGTPGSHVVIRHQDGVDVPRAVLEHAAQLAAWHSKARALARVEVHVCKVSDVSKPRGAKPGLVHIKRFKKIRVAPSGDVGTASQPP